MTSYVFFKEGDRVRINSAGPFKGLKGTVLKVDVIAPPQDGNPFLFYHIVVEGAHIRDPIWFQYDEVEPISHTDQID